VSIRLSGEDLGNAVTDYDGMYSFVGVIPARFGLLTLTASVTGEELVSDTEVSAGNVIIVPVGVVPFTLGATIVVCLAGVVAAQAIDRRVLKPARQARRQRPGARASGPIALTPTPRAVSFEDALGQIDTDIATGKDRAGTIASIYLAARHIARSRGIVALDSTTSGEFQHLFAGAEPLVATALSVIIANYESATFGHRLLADQNILDSRNCLLEIRRITARGEA
jgi:hypothetical protein